MSLVGKPATISLVAVCAVGVPPAAAVAEPGAAVAEPAGTEAAVAGAAVADPAGAPVAGEDAVVDGAPAHPVSRSAPARAAAAGYVHLSRWPRRAREGLLFTYFP
ncbi:hypothetical protein B5P43_28645 [Bacillus sp. SRB_336]|nr:hypothetical protein B5P43_28645 [Bacillus sp. SRB_336]